MRTIDLNCDMGEIPGACNGGADTRLMPLISSANIACGFHAGDPRSISETIRLANAHGASIGAHPSYPDRLGFGRRSMSISPEEVYQIVVYQIAAIAALCRINGTTLAHVKPHGALYNDANKDRKLAHAIVTAVRDFDRNLKIYALSGGITIGEGSKLGIRMVPEAFADRTYQADGSLTPRSSAEAMIYNSSVAASQAVSIVETETANSITGKTISIEAETICIHGDGNHAETFAAAINAALSERKIAIESPK